MSDHPNTEVLTAIIVTMLTLGSLVLIGLSRAPDPSNVALAPVAKVDGTPMFSATRQAPSRRLSIGADVTAHPSPSPTITSSAAASESPTTTAAIPSPTTPVTPTRNLTHAGAFAPTPVRVVVSTQKRSYVFYSGPATYVRADAFAPLPLASFPRPTSDNGRGLDWFPTDYQTQAVVDRFVPELAAMKIRWVVILQGMDDWNMIANDYLIDRLNAEGIQVVMRIDRQIGPMDWQRLGWIVARYRERGVRYIQIFNEPNVDDEWCTDAPHTPAAYVAWWVQAAQVVAANGGLPGFAPMSPQSDDSDLAFFQAALEELKRLGRFDLVNTMWISIHNYGSFDSQNQTADGFFRYRRYDVITKKVFSGGLSAEPSLPIIVTEGGLGDANAMANVIVPMYQFVSTRREPYFLAFAPWLIGNAVGGGNDPRWEAAAWFTGTLTQVVARPIVGSVESSPESR